MKRKKRKSKKSFKKLYLLVLIITIMVAGAIIWQKDRVHVESEKIRENLNTELIERMRAMLEDEKNRVYSKEVLSLDIPKNELLIPENIKPKQTKEKVDKKRDSFKSEAEDYQIALDKKGKEPIKESKKSLPKSSGKPKLVIIIDDMIFKAHVRLLKEIPYKITPSFLPPTKHQPDSALIAQDLEFYMIHLPLEAYKHATPEERTLKVGDSRELIHSRIKELKRLYPQTLYINNHTGSKFTSDYESMDKLLSVIKEEGMIFLDSKTSPNTQSDALAKKYGLQIHKRDVFLDNLDERESIQTQLKEAVRIAKRDGFAIAIGHPHKNTFWVLKNANGILEDVEVVYLKDL